MYLMFPLYCRTDVLVLSERSAYTCSHYCSYSRSILEFNILMEKQRCKFESLTGNKCDRPIFDSPYTVHQPYCIFHYGYNHESGNEILNNHPFQSAFNEILASGEGNWEGFAFPPGIKFPKMIIFAVEASGCRFNSLKLREVTFQESVNFSNSVFKDKLIFDRTVFKKNTNFDHCQFDGTVEFLNVHFEESTSFHRADFAGRTLLRANFCQKAQFSEAIFRDVTVFSGWNHTTLNSKPDFVLLPLFLKDRVLLGETNQTIKQKIIIGCQKIKSIYHQRINSLKNYFINLTDRIKNYFHHLNRKFARSDPDTRIYVVFEAESDFKEVIFLKPDKVLFSQVNLSKVYFQRTNLRGVRFLGVDWWQPTLNRNGIYDELFINNSTDGAFRYTYLPVLEETCRNARVALEENRSFNIASDFYVAEMEAIRQQQNFIKRHFFSVTALYRFVSRYGTSVGTAIRVLILIYLLHIVSSLYIQSPIEFTSIPNELITTALRSIKILLLMQSEAQNPVTTPAQSWFDVGLRLVGPIQIAMVAIAFRSRIKRH